MPLDNLRILYTKRKSEFESQLEKVSTNINLVSNLRLAVAVLFLVLLYFSFKTDYASYFCILALIGFILLVRHHSRLFNEKVHLENLVKVNRNELNALQLKVDSFDPGNDFIDPHHPYTHDLDIFGEGSLYQYINRCNTINGRKRFAHHLLEPFSNRADILEQQRSVKDLSERIDFRQHVQAAGMETGEQKSDFEQLLSWTKQPPFFKNPKVLRFTLIALPLVTLAALALTFFIPWVKIILLLGILAQWIVTGMMLKKINVYHDYISRKKNILEKYSRFLYYVENEKFESEKLIHISSHAHEAFTKIKQLASLVSAMDARTNALATVFVNSFLMYDLQCVYRLERWREANADRLPAWLNVIPEIEVLNSLGTYDFNHPQHCFAEISADLKFEAKGLAHPLINKDEAVVNDITFGPDPSVLIITGANMAGKSTFLRTIGVNLVLALNGAPVCAETFHCPVINLRSGMRTADSLKDHQSYFYAELNRLKTIMDELRSDKPLLILLDEILKGTNSNDKQAGSIALVRQLLPHPCLAIIATHDLALGDLEKEHPSKVRNYCFEANIENDQLSFDYKLKTGIAQKMNASFLMRKMGIIPG